MLVSTRACHYSVLLTLLGSMSWHAATPSSCQHHGRIHMPVQGHGHDHVVAGVHPISITHTSFTRTRPAGPYSTITYRYCRYEHIPGTESKVLVVHSASYVPPCLLPAHPCTRILATNVVFTGSKFFFFFFFLSLALDRHSCETGISRAEQAYSCFLIWVLSTHAQ
jgi:hypothetical protein